MLKKYFQVHYNGKIQEIKLKIDKEECSGRNHGLIQLTSLNSLFLLVSQYFH